MTPPNEPREPVPAEEVADALKAIAKPHPTDPSVTLYERKGQIVGWDRARLHVAKQGDT